MSIPTFYKTISCGLCLVAFSLAPGPAVAQSSAAATASVAPTIEQTKEMHGDWSVNCAKESRGSTRVKGCVISQTQLDPKTHQRMVTVEVAPALNATDTTAATLIMPFGLALDQGIAFQIDEAPAGAPAPFQTCLPLGCIVQLRFDSQTLAMLRGGTMIKLVGVSSVDGKRMLFQVPLKGLGGAVDRSLALTRG